MSFTELDQELEQKDDFKVQYGRPRIKDAIRDLVVRLHNTGLSERGIRRRLLANDIRISIGSVHNIIHERSTQKICSENHALKS